mmetsp:Transcript_6952/g.42517  ORF Transcript_6952/g.42517 Transcript_6952/m.42517 type:complete len:110 (-) Transcript_6952:477-806(-)
MDFNVSAAIGTVELTGLEMIVIKAWKEQGQDNVLVLGDWNHVPKRLSGDPSAKDGHASLAVQTPSSFTTAAPAGVLAQPPRQDHRDAAWGGFRRGLPWGNVFRMLPRVL